MRVLHTVVSSQPCVIARPINNFAAKLIVWCHTAGPGNYNWAMSEADDLIAPAMRETITLLVAGGYAVVCPALTGTGGAETFGNDGSTDKLAAVIAAALAMPDIANTKYALWCGSMGFVTAACHARRVSYDANLLGIHAHVPLVDLTNARGTDADHAAPPTGQGVAYAAINLAYGGLANDAAYISSVKATHDPATFGAAGAFLTKAFLGTNALDTVVGTAGAIALAAANPTKVTQQNMGDGYDLAGYHDFTTMVPSQTKAWFDALPWSA